MLVSRAGVSVFSQLVIWGFQVATGVVDVERALVCFRLANFKPAGGRCCGMGGQIETNRWRGIDRYCLVVVKGRVRRSREEYKTSQNSHQLCRIKLHHPSLPPSLSVQLCPSALAAAPASSLLVRSSGASFPREIPRQRLPPVCLSVPLPFARRAA